MGDAPQRIRASGGYRRLRSFRAAQAVYDATVAFCDRFVDKRSRTHDQMVQAARSGRQNIAEGSRAAATSSQTELRLTNVARASLDELLLDYEDYLRQHKLALWPKNDARAAQVRALGMPPTTDNDPPDRSDPSDPSDVSDPYAPYRANVEQSAPETAANTVICLIHQTNFLLDRQVRAQEQQFVSEGGYSERLAAARRTARAGQGEADVQRTDQTDRTDRLEAAAPACPTCGKPMVLRTARTGERAGQRFWGCSAYPVCKGTRSQA